MNGIKALADLVKTGAMSVEEAALTLKMMSAIADFHMKYGTEKTALILLSVLSTMPGVAVVEGEGVPAGGPIAQAN